MACRYSHWLYPDRKRFVQLVAGCAYALGQSNRGNRHVECTRKDNSPFNEQQITALQHGLGQIDATQTAWLSGYLAGQLAGTAAQVSSVANPVSVATSSTELIVFFGSQTGNGEQIALELAATAVREGIPARAQSLADLRPQALENPSRSLYHQHARRG